MAGKELLLDKSGQPRENGVFLSEVVTDNDTKAANKIIETQNNIMGPVVDGKAEWYPDKSHLLKCTSNSIFEARAKDKSLNSRFCCSNQRIKSICTDISKVVKAYKPHVGDNDKRLECLRQLSAIICHHCGDHSSCTQDNGFCSFKTLEQQHPDWTYDEVHNEWLKSNKRFNRCMDLSEEGIKKLQAIIAKRYNAESIDRIAESKSSNACEGFWSMLVKLSEGKRIQGCGTDLWENMVELIFCMYGNGNVERTRRELAMILGIEVNPVQEQYLKRTAHKRKADYKRNNSPEGVKRRAQRVFNRKYQEQKDPDKKVFHKTGKQSTKSNAKSKVSRCSNCSGLGHTRRICPAVRSPPKQNAALFDFGGSIIASEKSLCRKSNRNDDTIDWASSNLFS